jgi:hypothetical protein
MKNSVEVGSSLVETQTTLDYEQEQRQINKMVKNVNDVQSMLNLFSASTEDFSKEMTDTITLCKQYLDNVLEAFNNIQSFKYDTITEDYKLKLMLPPGSYEWSIKGYNSAYNTNTSYGKFTIKAHE